MSEVGSAFVRIRPNMTGFRAETETGVRSAFRSVAKTVGVAVGVTEAFRFGKDIIESAANLQKQVRGVRAEFGPASDEIVKFGEKSASSLGVSAQLADSTALRFGILFKNLGLSGPKTAEMAINFEKLAGSVSQIRNIDPASLFQSLPLALAGNLRSLKQLGIAIGPPQIKLAAFALGLVKNTKEAITPAIKAQAIYALAMGQFPGLLQQATAHSGDLANVSRRLKAEWSNAKEELGKGLLPAMVMTVGFFAKNLPSAIDHTRASFHRLAVDVTAISRPFGGAKNTILGFIGALALNKIFGFSSALRVSLAGGAKTAAGAVAGGAATEVTALSGLTAAYAEATAAARTFAGSQAAAILPAGGVATRPFRGPAPAVVPVGGGVVAGGLAGEEKQIGKVSAGLSGLRTAAATSARGIGSVFTGMFTSLKAAALGFGVAVKEAFISAVPILILTVAVTLIIEHWSTLKRWFMEFARLLPRIMRTAWVAIKEGGKAAAFGLLYYFTFAIRMVLKAASHLPFVGDKAKEALGKINDLLARLRPDFGGIADAWAAGGVRIGKALSAGIVKGMQSGIQAQIKTFGGTLPALSALEGHPVNDAISKAILKAKGVAPDDGLDTKTKKASEATATNLRTRLADLGDKIKAAGKLPDSGVRSARDHLKELGEQLADAIRQQAIDVRNAVEQAKGNLNSLAGTLSDSIGQILDKPIQTAQDKISRFSNLKSLEDLRRSVLLPGGKELAKDPATALRQLKALASSASTITSPAIQEFVLKYRSALLQIKQDQVNVTKETTTRRVADLTDAFNRGHLSIAQYKKKVLAVLTSDHVTYKNAGRLLGSAFADGFRQQVGDLFKQAGAIAAGPQIKGTTGQAVDIVKPLETLRTSQKEIGRLQREKDNAQIDLQRKILNHAAKADTAREKQRKLLQKQVDAQKELSDVLKMLGAKKSKDKNPGAQHDNTVAFGGWVK